MYEKKEKSYMKLQHDFHKLKIMLEDTTKECKAMRKEMEKLGMHGISSEALTNRKEDVSDKNFNKVQIVNKSSTLEKSKKQNLKKKSDDMSAYVNRNYLEPTPPPENRPHSITKASMYNSRKHVRSQSEYSRPHSSKKFYTKH